MAKSLVITPEMQVRINAAAGSDVDPTTIAAFECVALTTRPINKRGSIFEGAVPDPSIFADFATYLEKNAGVQLMVMHETEVLPTGRVFHAAATNEGLRAQFYVPAVSVEDQKLVTNLNNGVIGDVSMGMLARHLLCSQCNWDYRGADATFMNLYDRTCANDHVIGTDGVHLILKGVDSWGELSLCGQGASPGAKIVSRMKAALKNSTSVLESLAASGTDLAAVTLSTNPLKDTDDMSKDLIDKVALQATEIVNLTTAKTGLETQFTASQAEVTRLTAELAAANTAKDTAAASLATVTTAKETAEAALTTVKAENTSITAFLKENAEKAMIVLGLKAADVPGDTTGMIDKIKSAGVTLANLVAGSDKSRQERVPGKDAPTNLSAFTTRNLNQS